MMEQPIWKIEWNDGMSVGIPEIDEDHKRFVLLINEFNQSILDRMDLGEIRNRLQLILDDARRHFAHEERLFRQWNYPDAEEHASKHEFVIIALGAIMQRFTSRGLESEWINAGLRVKDLLITHLLMEDMKYAEFYRQAHPNDTSGRDRDTCQA